ncbi:protein FAM124B isoform X1 [Danio rerio]|uniref:Protein FAM124B isoform X1 n=2 Tax=Danio rerio TaxID=7955 RepID=A0AB32T6T1_DANRE
MTSAAPQTSFIVIICLFRCADLMANPDTDLLLVTMHLLTNPGDSLLLQHTLDCLLKWVRPGLRLFHVSERACPIHAYDRTNLCPASGYPSHAVTIFLHESYGEERILRVLEFLQCPPWQYHHTESCGAKESGVYITSSSTLLKPYFMPSRDYYSLGTGMPVWGVRSVHYGEELVRVTLHSSFDNYEDIVRLYETVLQKRAEEQKPGFCWFTLLAEQGFSLQLAIKQLSPGVRVEPCQSAVLQFRVREIGQLVPLLPNTCSPISATRWHTEDLDGNKILFQVKPPAQPQASHTSAFPLSGASLPSRIRLRSSGASRPSTSPCRTPSHMKEQMTGRSCVDLLEPRVLRSGTCGGESMGSDGAGSTPPGSSCYSSQRSSPAGLSASWYEPMMASESSIPCLLLEEEEEDSETNVDTGCAVHTQSALVTLSRDLRHGLEEAENSTSILTETQNSQSRRLHAQVDEFFI